MICRGKKLKLSLQHGFRPYKLNLNIVKRENEIKIAKSNGIKVLKVYFGLSVVIK